MPVRPRLRRRDGDYRRLEIRRRFAETCDEQIVGRRGTVIRRLQRMARGEIARRGMASHDDRTGRVDANAMTRVCPGAAEVRRERQLAGGIEARDEGIVVPAQGAL